MKLFLTLLLSLATFHAHSFVIEHDCPGQKLNHQFYQLCYSEQHEQASWTSHRLNEQFMHGPQKRTDNFRSDPLVLSGSAGKHDYRGSGFDRGHLVPAGDMKLNYQSMSESFYMSNISPQRPSFNRGIWRKLENQIRKWTQKYKNTIILTGPILNKNLPSLGAGISIPVYFYKIIFDYQSSNPKMIGFILKNEKSNKDLSHFSVSVDQIEALTGINFFSNLKPVSQKNLEQMNAYHQW